eukprot:CAMPEP_0170154432 /NCGR_PEP_ID=MMETSP0033_2-20121228/57846_1 /TAXON_ID=195969 /ORGANISM="Dolichomastix tenuilepis, Strain CCMP3274" /LENGTH=137 /DNA_ID=CAMNT_0010391677 /DNA_START=14 /DNA_END=424 /DNA_ORIENTATION=-
MNETGNFNFERKGLSLRLRYWRDSYHTLVNIPHIRFLGIVIMVYFIQFFSFAWLYVLWGSDQTAEEEHACLKGVHDFMTSLWFSVQTSMTIGYGSYGLTPNPECIRLNILVTLQAVLSLLVDYAVMGLMYSRLSRPA